MLLSNTEFNTLAAFYGTNGGSVSIDHVNGEYVMAPPLCLICQKEEEAKREFNRFHYDKTDITVVEVDTVPFIEDEMKKESNKGSTVDVDNDDEKKKKNESENKVEVVKIEEEEKSESSSKIEENNTKKENDENINTPNKSVKNKTRCNDDKMEKEKPPAKRRRKEKENSIFILLYK